jgi:hypothetical protein
MILSKILFKTHFHQHSLTLFLCGAEKCFSETPQKCPEIKEKIVSLKIFFYNVENFCEKNFFTVEKFTRFDCSPMYTISNFENMA